MANNISGLTSKDNFKLTVSFTISSKNNLDGLLKGYMKNQLLDLTIHSQVINDNFGHIVRAETIKMLLDHGFVLDQKVAEKICLQRNISLLKTLVETYNLKLTPRCLENACSLKNNGPVIKYIMDEGDVSPNTQCIVNYAMSINNSMLNTLVARYMKNNSGDDNAQAIYSDSE